MNDRPPLPTDNESDETATAPNARMLSWARNSAAYRLSRAMMTEKQLADAIRRKATEKFEAISAPQVAALVDAALRFAHDNKALDDRAYAEISTRSAVRSGKSRRAIAQRLSLKGVDRELATEAVKAADDTYAALVYARRRRLGPFRREADDDGQVAKDVAAKEMAALARQGFSYDIGRRILDMATEDAEAVLLAGPDVESFE